MQIARNLIARDNYSLEDIAEANGLGLDRVQAFAENAQPCIVFVRQRLSSTVSSFGHFRSKPGSMVCPEIRGEIHLSWMINLELT